MIKYTYKGVEHTVDDTITTLTTAQKYLEDNIIIEAEGGGVTPSGEILITKNGTYDVTDKAIATVDVAGGASQYPIIEGEGEHEVRFVDYDGTLIKVQYVNDGEDATAPELPPHDRLTFVQWNRDYTNVKHDVDIGALYKPTSGNTELFIEVTEETGLEITINFYKKVSSGTITFDWGDGTRSNFSTTGAGVRNITHTYSSYGEYMISIISTINYGLGGTSNTNIFVMGSNEDRKYGALKKCYCSEKVIELYMYCFLNNYNLEEFTMLKVTQTGIYSFLNAKLKAIIIPPTVTSVGNRIATFCDRLEYLIFPTNLTKINGPITNSTKIKKLILPENYKQTSYSYIAWYEDIEYLWYAKPDSEYTFGTSFGQYCPNLRYVPIYDNFTGTTSSATFWGSSINKIAFPPNTTQIGNTNLYQCGNLTDVYMYSHTPPTLGGTNVFGSANTFLRIHVYPEDLETYQNATNWSGNTIKPKLVGDLEGEFKDGYCQKISRN